MAEATAEGRSTKTADVSDELSEPVDIWFNALPAAEAYLAVVDEDSDYIIGVDTEMLLLMTANGDEDDMEYQIVYSANGGRSYRTLSAWQTLTTEGSGWNEFTCGLPAARGDTSYLIKAQLRSTGRSTTDAESEPEEIWMLTEEREVTAEIDVAEDVYEYTESITAEIAISEPASGAAEYQLQYSTDNKRWYDLSAHDWSLYDDGSTGYIEVDLNLAELNGDADVYIKVNARMEGSAKIEDYAIDSFAVYNIAPIVSAELTAVPTGDESMTLTAAVDDGGYAHTKEYCYSYALLGERGATWIPFTSWTTADTVTFTPSLSGDYMFKVEARHQGRLGIDAEDIAANADSGYYLQSQEDRMANMAELEPSASPSPSPSASEAPSPSPSVSASPSASAAPSASPSIAPISSLDYAVMSVLGEEADLGAYIEVEVLTEDLLGVLTAEEAPVVLVQLGEETYAVIIGYTLDEEGGLISLTLADPAGDTLLGGTEGILRAWYYLPAESEASPSISPSVSPSAVPTEAALEPEVSAVPASAGVNETPIV